LLVYPAVALALNGVWNLHYLVAATKRAGGRGESASPVTMVMVVAFSFFVFLPAIWTSQAMLQHVRSRLTFELALGSGLMVQYGVDFLLLLALAKVFQRFEASRGVT